MKNPFVKQNNNAVLIASIAVGTAVVGAATYFLMTGKGSNWCQQMMGRFGLTQNNGADEQKVDHTAYLKKPQKSTKTDRNDLLHHGTINQQPNLAN